MFCGLLKGKEQRMFGVNHQKKALDRKIEYPILHKNI